MGDAALDAAPKAFDVDRVRADFPALAQEVYGKPLVYLDNAASAQKPKAVIDEISRFYAEDYSNVHRGVHSLSQRATNLYEASRERVAAFLNAPESREVIFTSGTTDAINLVASSYGGTHLGEGDEVLVTGMEHHSNIVPWQLVCEARGARLRVVPVNDAGEISLDDVDSSLSERTKLVAVVHVSNALGTVNPVAAIAERAHARGIPVLLDGAQAAPHLEVDVQALGCDFYAFSGHKLFGPTGIGVLWGRGELLDAMPPYRGGGEMIRRVSFEGSTFNGIPNKYEAGTPHIAGAIGLAAAIDYLDSIDRVAAAAHEDALLAEATEALGRLGGIRLIGTAAEKVGVLGFVMEGVHPHDIGTILDREGVAIRAGHHCAQPLMQHFGVAATARASFAFYNTRDDVDRLVAALAHVQELFA